MKMTNLGKEMLLKTTNVLTKVCSKILQLLSVQLKDLSPQFHNRTIILYCYNILDEHRVQRYGDDHPEALEGESGSASVSPKGRGIVLSDLISYCQI